MYSRTRSQFTSADYRFIAETLAPDPSGRRAISRLADDPVSVTSLLHDRQLFVRSMTTPPLFLPISAHLFFYVFVYQALEKRGLDDDVVDYVAAVCVEFRSSASFWHLAQSPGGRALYMVDLLNTLAEADRAQQYHLRRYIGNATLFLTGFFPDFIFRRSQEKCAPPLTYYEALGRSQYGTAAGESTAYDGDAAAVLTTLAERFVDVRCAMNVYTDAYLSLSGRGRTLQTLQRQTQTLDEEGLRDSLEL
jgi:hypothetical protein